MLVAGIAGIVLVGTTFAEVVRPDEGQRSWTTTNETTVARTLRFAGSGERTVVIRLINGSIRVSGSDGDTVDLQVRKHIRASSDTSRREAERDVTLDIADNAAMVGAIAREPHGQVCGEPGDGRRGWSWRPQYRVTFDVTVRVPRGTRLALCAVNGGEIRVEQTVGDFQVNHVNGPIALSGVRGSGYAEAVNGSVAITFSDTPPAASRFKTINGDVTVALPPDASADLAMKTFNGGLFTDFDVQPLPAPAPVPLERRGAWSVYRSNTFTRVRVGRGGPEILSESFNGDVRVVRAAR